MPLISRDRLFHPRVIKEKLSAWRAPADSGTRRATLAFWADRIAKGDIKVKKETSIDKLFLEDIFGKVLGYTFFNGPIQGRYTCELQQTTSPTGRACDGALGQFYTSVDEARQRIIMVPIEAKDLQDDLDRPKGAKDRAPVQQLFDYLNDCDDHARFGILTNFQETRLYSRRMGWGRYEVFLTQNLYEDEEELRRFIYLFRPESLLWRGEDAPPLATELLAEGDVKEQEITRSFYRSYKSKREALFGELQKLNPEVERGVVLEKTQKVLDRVLFILFAEDRGLLPPETYRSQVSKQVAGMNDWDKLLGLFRALDTGGYPGIHQYNGKLFERDRELEALFILQDVKEANFSELAGYNFESEVSVRVLGHVLEQSISDIEEQKALFSNVKLEKGGKRKRDGVYYTPPFITSAIVQRCIGAWIEERRAELEAAYPGDERAQLLGLRGRIEGMSVLDPACGSGAFLVEAMQYLTERLLELDARIKSVSPEYAYTPAELGMEQAILKGNGAQQPSSKRMDLAIARRVLARNLYGVDINPESVEITKLSLWLQTAEYGYFLTDLSPNIRVGDSLIPDPAVSKLAFDWPAQFKAVMARGGFDVIIGNPPYVKLQTFRRLMPTAAEYLRANYKSCQSGNFDMYLPFIEQGLKLLHPQGWMGYIAPSLWLKNDYGRGLKALVRERGCLRHWVDFGWQQVFEDATTYTALQYYGGQSESFTHCRARLAFAESGLPSGFGEGQRWRAELGQLGDVEEPWALLTPEEQELLSRMNANATTLEGATSAVFQGLITSANEIYHLSRIQAGVYENGDGERVFLDDAITKPLLGGEELQRYARPRTEAYILFPYRENAGKWELIPWAELPENTRQYLSAYEKKLRSRESKADEKSRTSREIKPFDNESWYRFGRNQNIDKQHLPKLCVAQTVRHLEITYDSGSECAIDNVRVNGIIPIPTGEIDLWFLLGILNSKACDWYFRFFAAPKSHGYFEANKQYIAPLPIPRATPKQQRAVVKLAQALTEKYTRLQEVHGAFTHDFARDLLPRGAKPSQAVQKWMEPSFDFKALREEARKAHRKGDKAADRQADKLWDMPHFERGEWEQRLAESKQEHADLMTEIRKLEGEMNALVYSLYGLNDEQIALIETGHPLDLDRA